jgi:RNA-binding protein YhbY
MYAEFVEQRQRLQDEAMAAEPDVLANAISREVLEEILEAYAGVARMPSETVLNELAAAVEGSAISTEVRVQILKNFAREEVALPARHVVGELAAAAGVEEQDVRDAYTVVYRRNQNDGDPW